MTPPKYEAGKTYLVFCLRIRSPSLLDGDNVNIYFNTGYRCGWERLQAVPPSVMGPRSRRNFLFSGGGGVQHPKYCFDIVNTNRYDRMATPLMRKFGAKIPERFIPCWRATE